MNDEKVLKPPEKLASISDDLKETKNLSITHRARTTIYKILKGLVKNVNQEAVNEGK